MHKPIQRPIKWKEKNTTLNLQIQYITTVWFKSSSVPFDGLLLPSVTSSNLLTRKSDRGASIRNPFFRSRWFQYQIQLIPPVHTNLHSVLGGNGGMKKKYYVCFSVYGMLNLVKIWRWGPNEVVVTKVTSSKITFEWVMLYALWMSCVAIIERVSHHSIVCGWFFKSPVSNNTCLKQFCTGIVKFWSLRVTCWLMNLFVVVINKSFAFESL